MVKHPESPPASVRDRVAPIVTLHFWGVTNRRIPLALTRMVSQRPSLRRATGLRFAKLLGTGSAGTFSLGRVDPNHWGILAVWNSEADARVFEHGAIVSDWDRDATQRAHFVMRPLASRGRWARQEPFTPVAGAPWDGPVAAITRARLRPATLHKFRQAVPAIAVAAGRAPGLRLSTGIGEAPIGLQGTFSVWDNAACLNAFAYETRAHAQAIADTARIGWYSEELFARFALLRAAGAFGETSLADVTG